MEISFNFALAFIDVSYKAMLTKIAINPHESIHFISLQRKFYLIS